MPAADDTPMIFFLGVFSFHSDNDNEALNLLTHSRSPRAYQHGHKSQHKQLVCIIKYQAKFVFRHHDLCHQPLKKLAAARIIFAERHRTHYFPQFNQIATRNESYICPQDIYRHIAILMRVIQSFLSLSSRDGAPPVHSHKKKKAVIRHTQFVSH